MKKIFYVFILAALIGGIGSAQNYSVGDTATFYYYDPGFFSGYYSSKYMCRAVTDNAYIFSAEQPYKISGVYADSNTVIVYDPNRLQFYKFSGSSWSSFGVSGVKFTGKAYLKRLRAGRFHFYAVATDGIYVFNGSNWTKKLDRKDVVDATASPTTPSNLTQYLPYFLTRFSMFTTKRNYMGPVKKLPDDLYLDEGFEPRYLEDTTLSEWVVSGNVSVQRSIISGQQFYVMVLNGASSAEKDFSMPARIFKFKIVPVINNSNAQVVVDFKNSSNASVFNLNFSDDTLFLNDEYLAELSRYSIVKIWGLVNIPNNKIEIYLGDSLIFSDSTFAFSGSDVSKLKITDNTGSIYFDEFDVIPVATGIFPDPTSKNSFYLASTDGIYKYSSGTWSKIYSGYVKKAKAIDANILYALTNDNAIVISTDGGSTWDTLPQAPLETIYDFDVRPSDVNFVVASGVHGIAEYANGSWNDISGTLLNWSPPEFVDTVYAVGFNGSNELVLGTGQGVFMSGDSLESFVEVNTGILKSFITDEQATLLATYADSAYNTMNTFFNGLARDVDNDPRVVVLAGDLSPKLTSGETKIIPVLGVMAPELNYVENGNHPYGDGHEIIEIDVYDDSLGSYIDPAYDIWRLATYRAMAKLFFWTHDTNEEDWLIEGMGGIGEYLAKYQPGTPDTLEYKISPLYSIKKIEESPYKVDFFRASLNRPYLFLLHLWNKYGVNDLKAIFGNDVPPGVVGFARISRITGVSEEDLYKEWVLDVFTHQYMDLTPNLTINFVEKLFPPTYATRQTFLNWSFGGFTIELAATDTLGYLKFNGINYNGSNLFDVYYKVVGDTQIVHVTGMDEHGDKVINGLEPIQGQDTTVYNFIVFYAHSNLADNSAASYAVKRDTVPPTVMVNYFQNSLADQMVNVYAFTNEQLLDEVMDTVPSLTLIHGTDTSVVDFSLFDSYRDTLIYSTSFTLSSTGKYYLKALLQDFAGNAFNFEDSVLAWYLQGGTKAEFTGFNGEIVLDIPENAISSSGYAVYSIVKGNGFYQAPNNVYVLPNVRLNTPARIEISQESGKNSHVFVWYDGSWHDQGGSIDPVTGKLVAYLHRLGPVTVMNSTSSTQPMKFALKLQSSNVITRNKIAFEIAIPKATRISVGIYSADGRHIASIFNGNVKEGRYSFSYRVDDLHGGVYFLVVKNLMSGEKKVKKLIKF